MDVRSSWPACGSLLACFSLLVAAVESRADPEPLRDDLSVRWVMYLSSKMVRIERDPTDGGLYSLRLDGTIFRIDPESATATVAYTAADHGLAPRSPGLDGACGTANCDHTLGLAIGPDGTFYITGNRHGERTVRLARVFAGLRDGDGNRRWEEVRNLEVADIPLEEMREAARMRLRSATDPDLSVLLLNQEGDIVRFDGELIVAAEEHGVPAANALFIDGEGTWYLIVSDEEELRRHNIASIVRGRMEGGERVWSLVAETDPYPFSGSGFDHLVNAVAVGPDNRFLYVNSGSRTDHGEVKENQGTFPGLRETPLTAAVLRIPIDADSLRLPDDRDGLLAGGYLFADGLRNTFDLAFAANGDLFGAENGPSRDVSDELNWLREGHHYGFPWRMGGTDNPTLSSGYDSADDQLLSFAHGNYRFDPSFPPPPSAADFTRGVANLGPDGDHRRRADGVPEDVSDTGDTLFTFTAYRSPLGLVFDLESALGGEYQSDAFVLSLDGRTDLLRELGDPAEDLLHLEMQKEPDRYVMKSYRIVAGFRRPIDAVLVGRRMYVIDYGTPSPLWEITFPPVTTAVADEPISQPVATTLMQNYPNPFNHSTVIPYRLSRGQLVTLKVFDLAGQVVRSLTAGLVPQGRHEARWDGGDQAGRPVARGCTYTGCRRRRWSSPAPCCSFASAARRTRCNSSPPLVRNQLNRDEGGDTNPMGIKVRDTDLFVVNMRTRMPMRYGIACMTAVPHLFVRVLLEIDGVGQYGIAADGLPPKWFTKDPDSLFRDDLSDMLAVIESACRIACDVPHADTVFDLWQRVYRGQQQWAGTTQHPPLLWGFGVSLVERAVIDAYCRASDQTFANAVRENTLGIRLSDIYAELGAAGPRDYLPASPSRRVSVRHTVGLADPVTDADIGDDDRLNDGLPQSLAAGIQEYGLTRFKIKLCGDVDRDLERMTTVATVIREHATDFGFTLDGNEQFRRVETFKSLWQALVNAPALASFMEHLIFVEQPFHRDVALDEAVGRELLGWSDRPPLIIDESDGELTSLSTALARGYAGDQSQELQRCFQRNWKRLFIGCETTRRSGAAVPAERRGPGECGTGGAAAGSCGCGQFGDRPRRAQWASLLHRTEHAAGRSAVRRLGGSRGPISSPWSWLCDAGDCPGADRRGECRRGAVRGGIPGRSQPLYTAERLGIRDAGDQGMSGLQE